MPILLPGKPLNVSQIFGIYTTAQDRIWMIDNLFDQAMCKEALDLHPGLQNSVLHTLHLRLGSFRHMKANLN